MTNLLYVSNRQCPIRKTSQRLIWDDRLTILFPISLPFVFRFPFSFVFFSHCTIIIGRLFVTPENVGQPNTNFTRPKHWLFSQICVNIYNETGISVTAAATAVAVATVTISATATETVSHFAVLDCWVDRNVN